MSDSDKPFACKVPGCGQRFTNNDRLIVHRQAHTLSLKIGKKGEDSISDQTPTPTRFLRNCDEEGLFEELGENDDNPFDRDFKSATKQPQEKKTVEITVVNTPVPVTELPPPSINREPVIDVVTSEISAGDAGHTAPPAIQTVVIDGTISNASDFLNQTLQASEPEQVLARTKTTVKSPTVSVLMPRSINGRKVISPFIVHPDNPVPKAIPAPSIIVSNVQSIPTRAIVVTPTGNGKQGSFIKSAKQKLKETIRIHQSQGKDVKNDLGNIITQAMDEAVSAVKRPVPSQKSESDDATYKEKETKPIKRTRRSQEDITPVEKREKFLERNRAAATRCREKRKMWITALEKKAEEMSELNSQLQNEISYLKHEVAQLKGLLLAHRDCPLSINQQKANPGLFEQLANSNPPVVIDACISVTTDRQSAEAVATSALTQMAERATIETSCNI